MTEDVKPKRQRASLRSLVNQHCKDCTYDAAFKGGGTWREQVGNCSVVSCALHPVRPMPKPRKTKDGVEVEEDDIEEEGEE